MVQYVNKSAECSGVQTLARASTRCPKCSPEILRQKFSLDSRAREEHNSPDSPHNRKSETRIAREGATALKDSVHRGSDLRQESRVAWTFPNCLLARAMRLTLGCALLGFLGAVGVRAFACSAISPEDDDTQ